MVTIAMANGEGRRLPVRATVARSYTYVWEHRGALALPILALLVLILVTKLGIEALPREAAPGAGQISIAFFSFVVQLAAVVAFVVAMHRMVLLGERPSLSSVVSWDGARWRYLATMLSLVGVVAAMLPVFFLAVLVAIAVNASAVFWMGALGGMMCLAVGFAMLRLSLALPAAAVGDTRRLRLSWRATRGNYWRIFAVQFLTALPFLVAGLFVAIPLFAEGFATAMAGGKPGEIRPGPVLLTISAALQAVSTAVFAASLSLSYDVLVRGGGPGVAVSNAGSL